MAGLGRRLAEAEGENRHAVRTPRQLGRQRDIAVGRGVVSLDEPAVARELPPAVRNADEADRAGEERLIGGHRQMGAVAGGEQHAVALVVAAPSAVVGAAVDEMRRGQGEKAQAARARILQADLHQHRAAARVGDDALEDAKPAAAMLARQKESGNAVLERLDGALAVTLHLGEEARAVGDDQAEVANAGLIDARVIDLVENAVADGEPDAARVGEGRADAALGARGPARLDPGPPRRLYHRRAPRAITPAAPASPPRPRPSATARAARSGGWPGPAAPPAAAVPATPDARSPPCLRR